MDFDITNTSGKIIIRDGIANLDGLKFNMLGGDFLMSGAYDTKEPNKPMYDFKLKIDDLDIQESFKAFSLVRTYAPIAKNVAGMVSTDFAINGELAQDYMPKMGTVNGSGLFKVAQAALQNDSKIVSGLTNVTKLSDAKAVTLKDVVMAATIENGKINVKPFNFKFGDYPGTVEGSTSMDGGIDYNMKMDVPAGKLGSSLSSVSSQLGLGDQVDENSTIPMNISLGGTALDPKLQLVSSERKQEVKEAVTEKAKEEVKEKGTTVVKDLTKDTEAGNLVNSLLGNKNDSTAQDSTKALPTKEAVKEEVQDKAKESLQNLLKKRKKN